MTLIIENQEEPQVAPKVHDYDELGRMVEQNNEMLKEILAISQKTKRYIFTQQVMGVLKVLLIVIPLVLSVFYLTPLIKDAVKPYQELLNPTGNTNSLPTSILGNLFK